MSPEDFLRAVWPTSGPYCLAFSFRPKAEPGKLAYKHVVVNSVEEALSYADQHKAAQDLYYAMFSLGEAQVWDPRKHNYQTGEKGAWAVRTHANMHSTRCFFFDIDVGPNKEYPTQEAALRDLIAFVQATELPLPTLISSGGGLHVYWLIDQQLKNDEWLPTAAKLRDLAVHHGLKLDLSRTTDVSSVLRVPGTFNHKDPLNPRPVSILRAGPISAVDGFVRSVSDAVVRAGVLVKALPKQNVTSIFGGSNLEREYDGPPVDVKDVVKVCGQLRTILATQGNCPEPTWVHAIIGSVLFMSSEKSDGTPLSGEQLAHLFSRGHPAYDKDLTDTKIAYRRTNANAPTSCAKIAEVSPCGSKGCEGCPFVNDPSVVNPLIAARKGTKAPPPLIQQVIGETPVTVTIPDAPPPYSRLKAGGIAKLVKNADGDEVTEVIYPYDLYPLRRLTNENGTEQQQWCVVLPRTGPKEFTIDAPALYDSRKFTEVIAHQGIYPHKSNIPYLQDYMVAYISQLQKEADADVQTNHLGWADEYHKFILPGRVLCDDGTVKPAQLSTHASRATEHIRQAGELTKQVELLSFFNHPEYLPNQLFICCALAAPIFYATGHHGVIVNASGVAGSSKSTTLYTAGSLFGEPELYAINGTNSGATAKGRNERVTTYANLPICVDEITHLPVKDAVDLAMGITQPGHRIRLQSDGTERKSGGGYKATIMLATANSSLHALLSTDNTAGTAGSMRVLEMQFRLGRVHQKHEADEYLRELKQNFGHVGPQFVAHVMQNRARVEARVHEVMKEIDQLGQIQPGERFWSACIAAALVAAEIAFNLGLLRFDPDALRRYALETLLPSARAIVNDEYTTPIGLLADYLETIQASILRTRQNPFAHNSVELIIQNRVHGPLLGHFDMSERVMLVLKKGFKDYCSKIGASAHTVLTDLAGYRRGGKSNKVILNKNIRRTLGAGTEYAKAQSWCFVIDMTHPELANELDMEKMKNGPSLQVVGGTQA